MAAISAVVWWSSSRSISVIVAGLACRIFQAGSGTGRVRARAWPPARRTCAVMVSLVLVTVTSVSSSRAMRLRSRIGVGGSLPEFGGDLEGGLDGQRGERVDEELADVLVEGVAGDGGADRAGVADAVALAEVGGQVF